MKLTKQKLKRLIKEEFETTTNKALLDEAWPFTNYRKHQEDLGVALVMLESIFDTAVEKLGENHPFVKSISNVETLIQKVASDLTK